MCEAFRHTGAYAGGRGVRCIKCDFDWLYGEWQIQRRASPRVAVQYAIVDTDTLISDRYGAIEEIFKRDGEDAFRQMEREVATELATLSGLVIATGGRMMLDDHCAQVLGSKGRVFCLHASVEEIQRRYAADSQGPVRPLLASSEEDELLKLYAERSEAYSQFEQILTDGKSVDEVVEQIRTLLSDG